MSSNPRHWPRPCDRSGFPHPGTAGHRQDPRACAAGDHLRRCAAGGLQSTEPQHACADPGV